MGNSFYRWAIINWRSWGIGFDVCIRSGWEINGQFGPFIFGLGRGA